MFVLWHGNVFRTGEIWSTGILSVFGETETSCYGIKRTGRNQWSGWEKDPEASWQHSSKQVVQGSRKASTTELSVAGIVPARSARGPLPRPPWWTPDELARICGSWADQAMWLDEAGASHLGDYQRQFWAAIAAPPHNLWCLSLPQSRRWQAQKTRGLLDQLVGFFFTVNCLWSCVNEWISQFEVTFHKSLIPYNQRTERTTLWPLMVNRLKEAVSNQADDRKGRKRRDTAKQLLKRKWKLIIKHFADFSDSNFTLKWINERQIADALL